VKKHLLINLIILFVAISTTFGQQAFKNGDAILNLGIGIGHTNNYDYGDYKPAFAPSINASFEYGIYEIPDAGIFSIGGYGDIYHTWYNYDGYKDKWNYSILAVRTAFHLGFLNTSMFDFYGGLMGGVQHLKYKNDFSNETYTDNDFSLGLFAGGKIMFQSKLGVFAELGYGTSFLSVGVTYKF